MDQRFIDQANQRSVDQADQSMDLDWTGLD